MPEGHSAILPSHLHNATHRLPLGAQLLKLWDSGGLKTFTNSLHVSMIYYW